MRSYLVLAFLAVVIYLPMSCTSADTPPQLTNWLAFHLVLDQVSRDLLMKENTSPSQLHFAMAPVLADPDFVDWDTANHTFVITPQAAKRLTGTRVVTMGSPFVLMASGEPIYVGRFTPGGDSRGSAVPEIKTGLIVVRCFMGLTNVPRDLLQMSGHPRVTERLNALTNATTNVILRIENGLFAGASDTRQDMRITEAVSQLFRNREH